MATAPTQTEGRLLRLPHPAPPPLEPRPSPRRAATNARWPLTPRGCGGWQMDMPHPASSASSPVGAASWRCSGRPNSCVTCRSGGRKEGGAKVAGQEAQHVPWAAVCRLGAAVPAARCICAPFKQVVLKKKKKKTVYFLKRKSWNWININFLKKTSSIQLHPGGAARNIKRPCPGAGSVRQAQAARPPSPKHEWTHLVDPERRGPRLHLVLPQLLHHREAGPRHVLQGSAAVAALSGGADDQGSGDARQAAPEVRRLPGPWGPA